MITTKVMPLRDVRQQMYRLLDEAEADGQLVLLTRRELIELTDGGYRFQVELIRRWFTRSRIDSQNI